MRVGFQIMTVGVQSFFFCFEGIVRYTTRLHPISVRSIAVVVLASPPKALQSTGNETQCNTSEFMIHPLINCN